MSFFESKSRKYLNRTERITDKKSFSSDDELRETEKRLNKRFTDIPWEQEGRMEFDISSKKGEPAHMVFEYDSVIDEKMEDYLRPLRRVPDGPYIVDESRQESVRRIRNVVVTRGEYRFDLSDFAGDDLSVYIRLNPDPYHTTSFYNPESKLIVVNKDVTSPSGLDILFHESAHRLKDMTENPEYYKHLASIRGRSIRRQPIFTAERVALIRDERFADAFALRTLYRLLGESKQFEDLKKWTYGVNLKSYYTQDNHKDVTSRNLLGTLTDRLIHR